VLQYHGDDSYLELVHKECIQQLTNAGSVINPSNVILQFCRSYNCQVELYELVDGSLAEYLFQNDSQHSDESSLLRILHGFEEQYFTVRDWTPLSYAEATAGPITRPPPLVSLSLSSLRVRSDTKRAERRRRTPQIVKFLSPRPSQPDPQPISEELVQLRDITVSLQNTNSYTTSPVGLEAWAQFITQYLPDIAVNIDARATLANARTYEDSLRLHLKGYHVSVFPTAVEKTRTVHDDVGSIIITISPRLRSHVELTFRDPLGLGVVAGVLLKTPAMNILVVGA